MLLAFVLHRSGLHGIAHQHGNGQRADASRDWCVGAGEKKRSGLDVADERGAALQKSLAAGVMLGVSDGKEALNLGFRANAVDTDIDDRGAGADHLRRDEAGAADGGYEDVEEHYEDDQCPA